MSHYRIHIDIHTQTLSLLARDESIVKTYPISSASRGTGFEEGSFKTPTGNFAIREKIGGDVPLFMIFKAREPIGIWQLGDDSDDDFILTRILWLDGLDEANQNTHSRYIYIHGTNQENLLGTPASHGCIRMSNHDIVELFDIVPSGTRVSIH